MANNQYVNKVIFGNDTLIDLSSDTVAANKMLSETTAHDKSGATITGTIPQRSSSDINISYESTQGYQLVGIEGPAGYYPNQVGVWISNVVMRLPESGSHKFTVYIPNGVTNGIIDDYIPLDIEVDSEGNSNITDDTIPATGVSF